MYAADVADFCPELRHLLAAFAGGDVRAGGTAEARAVLEPFLVRDDEGAVTGIRAGDAAVADVHDLDGEDSSWSTT